MSQPTSNFPHRAARGVSQFTKRRTKRREKRAELTASSASLSSFASDGRRVMRRITAKVNADCRTCCIGRGGFALWRCVFDPLARSSTLDDEARRHAGCCGVRWCCQCQAASTHKHTHIQTHNAHKRTHSEREHTLKHTNNAHHHTQHACTHSVSILCL